MLVECSIFRLVDLEYCGYIEFVSLLHAAVFIGDAYYWTAADPVGGLGIQLAGVYIRHNIHGF